MDANGWHGCMRWSLIFGVPCYRPSSLQQNTHANTNGCSDVAICLKVIFTRMCLVSKVRINLVLCGLLNQFRIAHEHRLQYCERIIIIIINQVECVVLLWLLLLLLLNLKGIECSSVFGTLGESCNAHQ